MKAIIAITAAAFLLGACGHNENGEMFGVKQSCFNTDIGYYVPVMKDVERCRKAHAALEKFYETDDQQHWNRAMALSGDPGIPTGINTGNAGVINSITSGL